MAILRGGKRIGGFDIRIGLPRDRSLDNVNQDPRFRQQAGINPETTMGRFQALVNEAEGFARKARFYVQFNVPKGVDSIISASNERGFSPLTDFDAANSKSEENYGFATGTELQQAQKQNQKRVQAFCKSISMPSREAITEEIRHNGPTRKFVYDYKSAPITATFYTDKFMRERSYFELWQKAAFSNTTHNYNFYDNYIAPVDIFQLGQYASRQERDDVTYGVRLIDCYPKQISEVAYSSENNDIQTFDVTFDFRYWVNYFIDQAGTVELGDSQFRQPTVKRSGGLFGGLLGKLPPELRRAGRDVLNDLRRRAPIGRITGGRVFPPFKIPPLNI